MTHQEVAEAVEAWIRATAREISSSYPHPLNTTRPKALPDAAVITTRVSVVPRHADFPDLQQWWLRVFEIEASVMAEQGDTIEAQGHFHRELLAIGNALEQAAVADETLGGRLPAEPPTKASPRVVVDYSNPFVTYEDGTMGRLAVLGLTVAQPVAEPG